MLENFTTIWKRVGKKEQVDKSKEAAKERLHLVLMQDRANVSADFLDMMKQEIVDVIKKYIDVDENDMDVKLENRVNNDGTAGAPALYANIPIVAINEEKKKESVEYKKSKEMESKEAEDKGDDKENHKKAEDKGDEKENHAENNMVNSADNKGNHSENNNENIAEKNKGKHAEDASENSEEKGIVNKHGKGTNLKNLGNKTFEEEKAKVKEDKTQHREAKHARTTEDGQSNITNNEATFAKHGNFSEEDGSNNKNNNNNNAKIEGNSGEQIKESSKKNVSAKKATTKPSKSTAAKRTNTTRERNKTKFENKYSDDNDIVVKNKRGSKK